MWGEGVKQLFITYEAFTLNQFKKNGKLKKTAKHCAKIDILSDQKEGIKKVADYFKKQGFHTFTSPHFFTHIKAFNRDNEEVKIRECVNGFGTTPKTLFEEKFITFS